MVNNKHRRSATNRARRSSPTSCEFFRFLFARFVKNSAVFLVNSLQRGKDLKQVLCANHYANHGTNQAYTRVERKAWSSANCTSSNCTCRTRIHGYEPGNCSVMISWVCCGGQRCGGEHCTCLETCWIFQCFCKSAGDVTWDIETALDSFAVTFDRKAVDRRNGLEPLKSYRV